MEIKVIEEELTVCKLHSIRSIDLEKPFYFVGKTDEELSFVCPTADVPKDTSAREDGWRAFRIQGVLDFSLIGILSRISSILADNGIGLFAVSTYNTDYILVKQDRFEQAIGLLRKNGYSIV